MRSAHPPGTSMTTEDADVLAYKVIMHIVAEEHLILRFLALTGLTSDDLPTAIRNRSTLAAAMDFLMQHEPDLMTFCENAGVKPESVRQARSLLPDPPDSY